MIYYLLQTKMTQEEIQYLIDTDTPDYELDYYQEISE